MKNLSISQLVKLRSYVGDHLLDLDESGTPAQITETLELYDILSERIDKLSKERELRREADHAWVHSHYYKIYNGNKSVEEGWKQNWMKVHTEQEIKKELGWSEEDLTDLEKWDEFIEDKKG